VDLSTGMMELAKRRDCYDSLLNAELQNFLEKQPPACFDVAVCVDTLVYIGALERTYAGAAHILKPGGLFFATVEALPDDVEDDYVVDPVGRFKHSRHYLQRLADENGLAVLSIDDAVLRLENAVDVNGFVVGLQKPA
jgi:predicted TPR repeat methyltransferase